MTVYDFLYHLLIGLPGLITAIIALIKILRVKKQVQEIHVRINSRMDELLRATHRSGIGEGRAQVQQETSKQTSIDPCNHLGSLI